MRTGRRYAEREPAELLTDLAVTHGTLLAVEKRLRKNPAWLEPEQNEQVVTGLKNAITDPTIHAAVERVDSEAAPILTLHGIDESFFEKLQSRWPDLSGKQQQLCGMIRAGLPAGFRQGAALRSPGAR